MFAHIVITWKYENKFFLAVFSSRWHGMMQNEKWKLKTSFFSKNFTFAHICSSCCSHNLHHRDSCHTKQWKLSFYPLEKKPSSDSLIENFRECKWWTMENENVKLIRVESQIRILLMLQHRMSRVFRDSQRDWKNCLCNLTFFPSIFNWVFPCVCSSRVFSLTSHSARLSSHHADCISRKWSNPQHSTFSLATSNCATCLSFLFISFICCRKLLSFKFHFAHLSRARLWIETGEIRYVADFVAAEWVK